MQATDVEADERPRPAEPARSRLLYSAVSGAVGIVLVVLAVPQTVAAWASVAADPALNTLRERRVPTVEQLQAAVDGLTTAIAWAPTARRRTDLALVLVAQSDELPERRSDLLTQAERQLVRGLASDPASGFAWFRLALVREMLGESGRRVVAPAVQSVDLAPNARVIWLPRLALLLRNFFSLNEDEIRSVRSNIKTIWRESKDRGQVLDTVEKTQRPLLLPWALADDPELYGIYLDLTKPQMRK